MAELNTTDLVRRMYWRNYYVSNPNELAAIQRDMHEVLAIAL